jgi:putative nucleotidyltransferase with HDIG domain
MNLRHKIDKRLFHVISQAAQELGVEVYAVGGMVRDIVLNRSNKDLDFVTVGDGPQLAKLCAEKLQVKKVAYYKNYGTAAFHYRGNDVEFVGARKESYRTESRNPIVTPGTLEDDQLRRDFTINAMAISLQAETFGDVLDPFNGLQDLDQKRIQTPTNPDITFSDDPLRMLRAVRFASQLQFDITPDCLEAIARNAHRLKIISQERISTEVNKIILSSKPSVGFKLLFDTQLLHQFFPEIVALQGVSKREGITHKDNFYHTLEVLDNVAESSNDLWLRWAAILHDIAKPPTKRFEKGIGWTFHGHEDMGARMVPKLFERMRLPLDTTMKFVQKMVQLHLRPIALTKSEISDSALRRLLFDAGDDIDQLMILCKADITSKNELKVKKYLKNYEHVMVKLQALEEKDRIRNFQPPISGEMIMKTFNIGPCAQVGMIKNAIKDAILDGVIANNESEAMQFMFKRAQEVGLNLPN